MQFDPKKLIETIKEKITGSSGIFEKLITFFSRFHKPESNKPTSKKKKKGKASKFKLVYILYFVCLVISLSGLTYLVIEVIDYFYAKEFEVNSKNYRIISNFEYGKKYLLMELKVRKIKRKHLRTLNRELNGEDWQGRVNKYSPCDESVLAFGEYPDKGNIVIKKPDKYKFVITAYDCNVKPLIGTSLIIKKPDTTNEHTPVTNEDITVKSSNTEEMKKITEDSKNQKESNEETNEETNAQIKKIESTNESEHAKTDENKEVDNSTNTQNEELNDNKQSNESLENMNESSKEKKPVAPH